MLPSLGEYILDEPSQEKKIINEGIRLQDLAKCTGEIATFDGEIFNEVIDYKWNGFVRGFMMFGFLMHLFYIVMLTIYIM